MCHPEALRSIAPRRDVPHERLRHFGFAGLVGLLPFPHLGGICKSVSGLDAAAMLTAAGGYRIFNNAISRPLE
jgi:hypothetical protein